MAGNKSKSKRRASPPEIPPDSSTAKVPRTGWKTGEQLEFLLSHWQTFKRCQDGKKLTPFWPYVYDHWYQRWPIVPTPDAIELYGTPENARLMLQEGKNAQIKGWFNNRCRADSGKMGRGDLKLDIPDKRMLAAVQAYCSYAWDSIVRPLVLTRWEQQKGTETFADAEDPLDEDEASPSDTDSGIPLTFKIKVATELYDLLPAEEKRNIDRRRAEDKKKLYRSIPQIPDDVERRAKLRIHKRNQPFAAKSLLRVLKNLEDQTGCIAQVMIASVDPQDGTAKIQKFCQGQTELGLNFETFYGDGWAGAVEQKFGEWAVRVFGDKDSTRRGMYRLPEPPAASSTKPASETVAIPNHLTTLSPEPEASSSGTSHSEAEPTAQLHSAQDTPTPTTPSDQPVSQPTTPGAPEESATQPPIPRTISMSDAEMDAVAAVLGMRRPVSHVDPSQVVLVPSMSLAEFSQSLTAVMDVQPDACVIPTPLLTTNAADVTMVATQPQPWYRARNLATVASGGPSRRGSIDGVPEMVIDLPEVDSTGNDTSEITVDLSDYISLFDGSDNETHVSSSQKSSDECRNLLLSLPPPSSQPRAPNSPTHAQLNIDEDDLPTWMLKKKQWKYIASTPGGPAWENLLKVYMQQERRLEFTEMGATLTNEDRPSKIKEYFQHAHQPLRGDTLAVPDFGVETAGWWEKIQPEWRRAEEDPPQGPSTWSYILSGGSKGTFLIIMCLAWWARAHTRYLEEEKSARQTKAKGAGATANFDDLPDQDNEWLRVVNDVTFVMEKAQKCDIPSRGISPPTRATKRKHEGELTPRKRSTTRAAPSRTRSKA